MCTSNRAHVKAEATLHTLSFLFLVSDTAERRETRNYAHAGVDRFWHVHRWSKAPKIFGY